MTSTGCEQRGFRVIGVGGHDARHRLHYGGFDPHFAEAGSRASIVSDTITTRQRDVLNAIERLTLERGFPPTIRELGNALGLSSTGTTARHVRSLQVKGYIAWDEKSSRTIRIVRAA